MSFSAEQKSIFKVGGVLALLSGVGIAIASFLFFTAVPESFFSFYLSSQLSHQFFVDYAAHAGVITAGFIISLLQTSGLFSVLVAYFYLAKEKNKGLVAFSCLLGGVSGILSIISCFGVIKYLPIIANKYFVASPVIKETIIGSSMPILQFDEVCLTFTGIVLLVNGVLSFNDGVVPKSVSILRLMVGGTALPGILLVMINNSMLIQFSIFLGSLLLPIWAIVEGLFLLRVSRS